ncbi:MAG: sulfatase-like hydrolase/transferase [Atopobiaceae bacterium]|nr:sulfatase-like hydrolase/transferase [Atopobiaceae bacterium]
MQTTYDTFPLNVLAYVVAGILLVLAGVVAVKKPQIVSGTERSSAGWIALFAILSAAFGVSLSAGLYQGTPELGFALLAITALSAFVSLLRRPLAAALERIARPQSTIISIVRDVVLLAGACGLSFLALELPWNDKLPLENPNGFIFELSVIGLVLLVLYLIGQRRGSLPAVAVTAFSLIGIAQSYVIRFKGTTIRPGDLYSLGTAAAVAGNYDYYYKEEVLLGVMCAVGALGLLSLILPLRRAEQEAQIRKSAIARLVAAAAIVIAMLGTFSGCSLRTWGIAMHYWDSLTTIKGQGFLTGFLVGVQDLKIRVPENYSEKLASDTRADMAARYDKQAAASDARSKAVAQFSEEAPSIVVVMNEAFSNLADLGADKLHYEGPRFFTSGDPRPLRSGQLAVSVLGGGTCNSEFEFLTGVSMAFVGSGKYPYAFYDLTRCGSIVTQLKELGYDTTGMHPGLADNWNRAKAYESFGFNRFWSIADFPKDAPRYHQGVSDAATYEQVLKKLEDTSSPQFIFDVTMQGHSGYDMGNAPADYRAGIVPEGFSADDGVVGELNEYLDSVDHSDADLEAFVKQIMELDRKVILVFFGDHKPSFAANYNDVYFEDEDYIPHTQRTHHSDYAVWANYDIAGNQAGLLETDDSADVLSARMLELIGAPLTDFQKARLLASEDIAQMSYFGYQDNDGGWHPIWDEELEEGETPSAAAQAASEALYDLSLVEYLEFGSKY